MFDIHRHFSRPDLGPNISLCPIKKYAKTSNKKVYIIPKCLVLHFGENFMEIGTKTAEVQVLENLHINVNENMFSLMFMSLYERQLKQQTCYSFTLLISFMVFNPFQMAVQFVFRQIFMSI